MLITASFRSPERVLGFEPAFSLEESWEYLLQKFYFHMSWAWVQLRLRANAG